MNAEYAGFFDIGMVERNEVNAIIVHGTMCLIRRTAMDAAGGWSSDTICEDSDLGLTILELGWRAHYTNRRYGWGLLPQDYLAFRTQRARWAGGAVQIVKKHWRRFLPGQSQLDHDQKREFAFGWLSWFGVEIIAVGAALLNLIWVPFVVFQVVAIPDPLLLLPSVAAFLVSLLHFVSAYRTRVAVPYRQMLGAMVVFMSVQWTVASAAIKAALPAQKKLFPSHPQGRRRHRSHALCGDARSRAWFAAGRGWHHGVCDQFLPARRNRFVRRDPDHPEPAIFVGGSNGGVRAIQRSREQQTWSCFLKVASAA